MPNVNVKVGGTKATDVIDVDYDRTNGGDVGQANITVGNTQSNRNLFTPGVDVTIEREDPDNPGTFPVEWRGEVIGKPSNTEARNVTMTVEAETKLSQLEYAKVDRPFIERDTGTIVKKMIQNKVDPDTKPKFVTKGDDTTNWSSDANVFELGDIDNRQLNDFGDDFFYADFVEGNSGTWSITNTSVGSAVLPGRRILKVDMRLMINNRGSVFTGELEIRDHDGINYVWDLDLPDYVGFETFELFPEDATYPSDPDLTTDGTVELRVTNVGGLPEDRALALDMIRTTPFSTTGRETTVTTNGVETTGRTITRKLSGSVVTVAQNLAQEDGAVFYIDTDEDVHYESAGDTAVGPDLNISDSGDEHVVDATFDRDFDNVRNQVTVQGKDDLQASFEDTASIDFYNQEAPKEEPIVDKSIRTQSGLEARARGFLNDNAWQDGAMTFTIGDARWEAVEIGQSIDITWSPEDIDDTYIVSSVATTTEGYVVIGVTGKMT